MKRAQSQGTNSADAPVSPALQRRRAEFPLRAHSHASPPRPPPSTHLLSLCLCASVVNALALGGCQAPPRTTRLHTRDFQDISTEIAFSLQSSSFIQDRTPDSPSMTIAIEKIDNLTTDILSEGEKWFLMDRVMNSDAMTALRRERNIRFVIPAERLDALIDSRVWAGPIAQGRAPTHVMHAVLRSVTRAAGPDRTDLYSARYSITALNSGETVWTGDYLLKRAASGRAYN